jgi:isoleucyl-tRNA synthetase
LDLNITPQLKEEGMVRELIRLIQDLRKEKGLTVNDKAVLKIDTDKDGESFVEKNKTYISSVAQLSDIQYSKLESEFMDVSGLKIKISI